MSSFEFQDSSNKVRETIVIELKPQLAASSVIRAFKEPDSTSAPEFVRFLKFEGALEIKPLWDKEGLTLYGVDASKLSLDNLLCIRLSQHVEAEHSKAVLNKLETFPGVARVYLARTYRHFMFPAAD